MRNNLKSQVQNFMIKELRERAGLTQEQLAVKLNISSATLRRWEKEGIAPAMTVNEWLILCTAVGIRFSELPSYFGDFSSMSVA